MLCPCRSYGRSVAILSDVTKGNFQILSHSYVPIFAINKRPSLLIRLCGFCSTDTDGIKWTDKIFPINSHKIDLYVSVRIKDTENA